MIASYVHGPYPRSERLVAATRDLDRGRTTAEAVAERTGEDLRDLVDTQEAAGLDFYSDGLLAWQDLFRPFVEASGMVAGGLARWFDNDSFYRTPETRGEIGVNGQWPHALEALRSTPEPRVATLPSPYLFSRVTAAGGVRPDDLMVQLTVRVLRPVAERLVGEGCRIVHLQEPWVAYHGIGDSSWAPFEESLRTFTDGLGATSVLHTSFGDAARHAGRLRQLPVDVVGFDFVETDLGELADACGNHWKKGLLIGCIDGRRSLVEDADDVTEFVGRVVDRLRPESIYLSPASELDLLPQPLAKQKVAVLGEVTRRAKESFA